MCAFRKWVGRNAQPSDITSIRFIGGYCIPNGNKAVLKAAVLKTMCHERTVRTSDLHYLKLDGRKRINDFCKIDMGTGSIRSDYIESQSEDGSVNYTYTWK